MARPHTLSDDALRMFAEMMHHGFTRSCAGSPMTHIYSVLLPADLIVSEEDFRAISPNEPLWTADTGSGPSMIPVPGAPGIKMLPFTINGHPHDHLTEMVLPEGALALGLACEVWVRMAPKSADFSVEPKNLPAVRGWWTTTVSHGRRAVHLTSLPGRAGSAPSSTATVSGRTLDALHEVMNTAYRNNT